MLIAAACAGLCTFFSWQLDQSHQQLRETKLSNARLHISEHARSLASEIDAILHDVDTHLRHLREQVDIRRPDDMKKKAGHVFSEFPAGAVVQIAAIDHSGYLIFSTVPKAGRIFLGDRDHFTTHTGTNGDNLYISRPVLGRASNKWSIQFSRPLFVDKRFAGVLVLSIDPDYLAARMSRFLSMKTAVNELLGRDGSILVRSIDNAASMGRAVPPDRPFLKSDAPAQGNYYADSSIDGIHRLFAWHALPGYPLIAQVGFGKAELLAQAEAIIASERRATFAGIGVVAGLGLMVIWLLLQLARRQDSLANSEDRFRRIFDASPLPLAVSDREQNIILLNPAFIATFGYTRDDLPSIRDWWPLAYPDPDYRNHVAEQWSAGIAKAHSDGIPATPMEVSIRCKDGSVKSLIVTNSPLGMRNNDEQLVTFYDITEQRALSDKLQQSHDLLNKLSAEVPGVIFQYKRSADGHASFPFASWAMIDLCGCLPEQVIDDARPVFAWVHPDDLAALHASIEHSASSGEPWQHEFRILDPERGTRWNHGLAKPETRPDGSIVWHGFITDVTQRKAEEQKLLLAESVFMHSADGILVTDADTTILAVNPAFTEISGYTAAQAIGRTPRIFKSGHHDKAFYQSMWRQLLDHGIWQGEIWNRRKNGVAFPERLTISAVKDSSGKVQRYIAMFHDVSERHRYESELIEARDNAKQAARVKAEFLANMSHEVRTPMNGIIGLSRLALYEAPHDTKLGDYLSKIHRSAESLLEILNDILDYSKIEAGRMLLENRLFDINQVLTSLHSMFSFKAEEKAVGLHIDLAGDVPGQVIGDRLRLQQILANLLGNAIKFTDKGEVTLAIRCITETPSRVKLTFSVSDTGIGMSKDVVDHLFQPFTQADSSISRRFGGTGLGLAISRSLLYSFGSHFEVASTPGQGSSFTFSIFLGLPEGDQRIEGKLLNRSVPNASITRGANVANALNKRAQPLAGAHVLVVDDSQLNRQIVGELLRLAGLKTTDAASGRDALELISKLSFDAVLMDVQMPEMDGLAATRNLRRDPNLSSLPVIGLSAGVSQAEQDQALASGMNGFLCKPIVPEQMIDLLLATVKPRHPASALTCSEISTATADALPPATPCSDDATTTNAQLDLPGFDLSALVEMLGSTEAALRLLKDFKKQTALLMEEVEQIAPRINTENQDLKALDKIFHRLKGSAGSYRAIRLHACAEILHTETQLGRIEPGSLAALRAAWRDSEHVLDVLEASTNGNPCRLEATLRELAELLSGNDLVPVSLLAQIDASLPLHNRATFASLRSHLDNFNYAKARDDLIGLIDEASQARSKNGTT